MGITSRFFNPKGYALWVFIVGCYVSGQAWLYAQPVKANLEPSATPWDHLTLEGALALAVGALSTVVAVQYRENRKKDQAAVELAVQSAEAIAKATTLMSDVTKALERLSEKIECFPAKPRGY